MMQNVDVKVDGTKLVISVDLSKDFGLSKSGKTHVVASTGGFTSLPGGAALNLNVIKK